MTIIIELVPVIVCAGSRTGFLLVNDNMKRQLYVMAMLIGALGVNNVRADYPIEVIELQSRPVEDVIPLIKPFVGPGGTVTGFGSRLIIKAAPQQLGEVKRILAEIDTPPMRLLITVDKGSDELLSSRGYRASADIRLGDSQISINSPGRPVQSSRAQINLHDKQLSSTQTSQQFVQAVAGQRAYISSGLRVPLQTSEHYYGAGIPYHRSSTTLQDVTRGFYVIPRVHGDSVTLEIAQHDDTLARRPGVIDTQRIDSMVRGRLGEWISLGGLDSSQSAQTGGLGQSERSQQRQFQDIRVKVECLDCAGRGPDAN